MGTPAAVVVIDGSRFAVHRWADRVEVYRISAEAFPRRAEVLLKAQLAILRATGCPVRPGSLQGDQALVKARLACDGAVQSAPILPDSLIYECDIVDNWDIASLKVTMEAIECTRTVP
ncbi:MAG TPA: hypothetical protein ENJ52_06530 [Aliiroseovarius sp.]|nr:hypothetical protein [Aliiroseovarius sp.]